MTDEEVEQMLKMTVRVLFNAVLGMLQEDPHTWSTRPCQTCRAISGIIGEPFGCYLYAEQRRKEKEKKDE